MSKESQNLRDLIASVITGNTINTNISTATDMVRAVITDGVQPAININIGGGSGGDVVFPGDVTVTGDLTVSGNTYQQDEYTSTTMYIGVKDAINSWKVMVDVGTGDLVFWKFNNGSGLYDHQGTRMT